MCPCVFNDLQLFYTNFQRICIWRRDMSFCRTVIDVSYWHWSICSKFSVTFEMEQLWLFYHHFFLSTHILFTCRPCHDRDATFCCLPSPMHCFCCQLSIVSKIGKTDGNIFFVGHCSIRTPKHIQIVPPMPWKCGSLWSTWSELMEQ